MMKKHDAHEKKDKNAGQQNAPATDTPENGGFPPVGGSSEHDVERADDSRQQEAAGATEQADAQCRELKESLLAKEKDFAVLSDKYLRLMAEYDNFRRRSQKEKEALYADSIATVAKEWLPVLDSIDLADIAAAQYQTDEARQIAAGLAKIQKQVDEVLERLGIEEINCLGQAFNPELHEAVMHVEDDSVSASTVVEQFQKGYCRKDKVIRHSVVKVAN